MKKFLTLFGALLLAVIAFQVVRTLHAAGSFKKLFPIGSENTFLLEGMIGAEDITIDRSLGMALVSADDRRGHRAGEKARSGIYLLDYKADPPTFQDLTRSLNLEDFHPHGISLYHHLEDSTKWVFVVNHGDSKHAIEIFEFTDSSLIHAETITDENLVSPNDVVGVGKREFYFTNDHGETGGMTRWRDYLMIGTGQLCHYDGQSAEVLDSGLGYSNGVNLSQDGRYVLVATSTDRQLLIYSRSSHQRVATIDCETGLDNIELTENGDLLIGCHPKLLAFQAHASSPTNRSPSHIISVTLNQDDFSKSIVKDLYMNNGDPLSGSSVAASDGNILLMGTVFEDGVLFIKQP